MGESSRVVTFFSRDLGKIKGVAKGISQPKSKLTGKIELFNLIEGDFYKKETTELGIISGASLIEDFRGLTFDPRKYGFASAWCEILDKISHAEEPHQQTFMLTFEYFKSLQLSKSESSGLLFWSALMRLLAIEGCAPQLNACVSCGSEIKFNDKSQKPHISVERGGLICVKCIEPDEPTAMISESALKLLHQMESMPLTEIANIIIDKRTGKEAAEVILSFAGYHLGLPRNLKSFKFLEALIDFGRHE